MEESPFAKALNETDAERHIAAITGAGEAASVPSPAEQLSLLHRGVVACQNLGKTAFSGGMVEQLAKALRRPF